jgi:putative ABC transport system substrate-binding protein
LLINPTSPAQTDVQSRELQTAARSLGLALHILKASTESEIDEAFAALVRLKAGGLVIGPDVFYNMRSQQLAALALRHAIPTIYQYREFVAAGDLMSYGTNLPEMFQLCGVYTGRILKGEQPVNLPVQQATKVDLILNIRSAKMLGLTLPTALLVCADEVIPVVSRSTSAPIAPPPHLPPP